MDDMTNELLPELMVSDLVVYATPLYNHGMNATMSVFRERMLPMSQPFIEKRDGKRALLMRHPLAPAVWLSVCGCHEESEFDAFSNFLNSTCHPDTPIVAEIYRTSSEALRHPVFNKSLNDILEAMGRAGHELVLCKKVTPDTMKRIRQPLMDPEYLTIMGNLTWKTCIAEDITVQEFLKKGMMPRPDSLETFMAISVRRLNAEAARGKKVILQFKFFGEVEASCYFTCENGSINATAGTNATYDVHIETPFELWMDIMAGKAEGREMFMQGKYRIEGDLSLMRELFQREGH
jgi:putative sterol carrier protein